MQFTPEVLRKHAQRRVDQEVESDRSVMAAYLRGSLLYGPPLLGGAGDIDIVFIHSQEPDKPRQIEPLTPELQFDLAHHDQLRYREPHALRTHPWLGPTLYDAQPLHDPRHFIDYTQSGVRSNFHRPENVGQRAARWLESARQFWMARQLNPPPGNTPEILAYLNAVHDVANALSSLKGRPLPPRRVGWAFFETTAELNLPHLYPDFIALLGGEHADRHQMSTWLEDWERTVDAIHGPPEPHRIHALNKTYYLQALKSMLHSDRPTSPLWTLLKTWAEGVLAQPKGQRDSSAWQSACQTLGLWGDPFQERLSEFDAFLDQADQAVRSMTNVEDVDLL